MFMLSPPAHVHGGSVDVGPDAAIEWLALNGAWYGLCQIYGNEPWHLNTYPTPSRTAVRRCTRTRPGIRG